MDRRLHRTYNGFEITAYAEPWGTRFVPMVVISKDDGVKTKEAKKNRPGPPVESEDDAVSLAMEYGIALVDGNVKGFDLAQLLITSPMPRVRK